MEKVSGQKRKSRLRGWVFWPPFLVLLMVLILGFVSQDAFLKVVNGVKDWIWGNFKWLFSGYGLAAVGVCFYACFSKFGNTVIGGKDAKPILGKFNWFAISLCTTIAAGLMFWAAAEPLYLMSDPSPFFDIEPNSPQAAVFAMAQMYLHWGITPYAIYALAATVFAFTYYNMKKPFSLGACISPLLGERATKGRLADIIDALCIFILCAGMSGSLSTGAFSVAGGISNITGIPTNGIMLIIVMAAIILVYTISASSGIMKGIKWLSSFNVYIFSFLILFIFLFGPTKFILNFGVESVGELMDSFFMRNLFTDSMNLGNSSWSSLGNMKVGYWASYLAWAPVTALFLGKLARGYKIRDCIIINLFVPTVFSMIWVSIFGGTAIHMHMQESLIPLLETSGAESIVYKLFEVLPLRQLCIPIFVLATFISFVTAADSNTNAIASVCTLGMSEEEMEAPAGLKILWGMIIGVMAAVMAVFTGVGGAKTLASIGGFPSMFLQIASCAALIKIMRHPEKYDKCRQDTENGKEDTGEGKHVQDTDCGR